VGLVQREIESAGFVTITLSNIPELTASVCVPRLVGIEHPFGQTVGMPGDTETQLGVMRGVLAALESIEFPGEVRYLPFTWHQTLKEIKSGHKDPPPIGTYLAKNPWLIPNLIARNIPDK